MLPYIYFKISITVHTIDALMYAQSLRPNQFWMSIAIAIIITNFKYNLNSYETLLRTLWMCECVCVKSKCTEIYYIIIRRNGHSFYCWLPRIENWAAWMNISKSFMKTFSTKCNLICFYVVPLYMTNI